MMNKTAEIHKAGYNCGLSIGLGNPVLFNFGNDVREKGIVIGYGANMDGTINYVILPQTKIKNLSNGTLIRNVNTKHILNGFEYEDNYVFVGVENVFYVNESKPKEVFYGICFDPIFNNFKVEETKIDKFYVKIYKKKVNAMNSLNELNEKIHAVKCFDIENLYTEEDIKKITEIVSNDVGNSRTVIYKNHYVKLVIEAIGLEYKFSISSNLHRHQVTRTEIISSIDLLVAKVSNAINLLTDSVLVVLDKNYRIINKKENSMERYIIVAYQKNGMLEKEITLNKYYGSVDENKVLSFNSLGDKATIYNTYRNALLDIKKYIERLKSTHTQDQFILWGRQTELEVKRLSEAPTTTKQIKIVKQSNVFDSTLEEDVNQALIDLKDKSVVDIKIIEETEFASAYAVIVYKTDVYEIENSKTQSLAGRDYKEEV